MIQHHRFVGIWKVKLRERYGVGGGLARVAAFIIPRNQGMTVNRLQYQKRSE